MDHKSPMRGVNWSHKKQRWRVNIGPKPIEVGVYKTVEEAIAARQAAELIFYGKHLVPSEIRIENDIAYIPIFNRMKLIIAYAKVDPDLAQDVNKFMWYLDGNGYAVSGKSHHRRMHRMVLGITEMVDHVNRDKLDNRRENLRRCTRSENMANRVARSHRKYDLPRGVFPNHDKFAAVIRCNNKAHWLGSFNCKWAAAAAYDEAAKRLHGEFALTNREIYGERYGF